MNQTTVCSLCARLWQLYDDAKRYGLDGAFDLPSTEPDILKHLQAEHGVKKWEPIPA